MKIHITQLLICLVVGLLMVKTTNAQTVLYYQTGEEFCGPFASWKNVKTVFGAKGDGVTNDAPAINKALAAMQNPAKDSFNVLYFPAGTYLINDSLFNPQNGYDGMAIIGEDPATTIISWGGQTGGDMFNLDGWYLRVSRLTFEGNNKALRGISKTGGFSTHNEFSDLVFKDFSNGIGLDFSNSANGQAENAIIRCTFKNCSSGIASCNYNSLDQWVWNCLFEDCRLSINQCTGYFQIYNNVFLRSKVYDIGSSPYKNVIANNVSVNSKCFFNGYGAYLRGNKIYSNVDSFITGAGSNVVMLDNIYRCTGDSLATMRVGSAGMFVGNTFSTINSKWSQWPVQPPSDPRDHGSGAGEVFNKQIEKGIDGNPATSFETDVAPFGIKWNCPHGTERKVVKYTVAAPVSGGGTAPANFQLLGSNNFGYSWDILDYETNQTFTGGGNPITYPIKNKTAYSMYELLALNYWQSVTSGGRSIINTGAQAGTFCEKIVAAQFPRNVYQNITVHADTAYNVSAWMQSAAITTNASVVVIWYSTAYPTAFIGGYPTGYIKADTIGVVTGTSAWTSYTKTLTAPVNAQCAQVYFSTLSTPTATGTAYFDSFTFASAKTPAKNILLDAGFEAGQNPGKFEVNELTLLDSTNADITKDAKGFVSGADESWGNLFYFDNKVLDTTAIPLPATIPLPGTPQNHNRKVFEVAKGTGNDANEIQTQINLAAQEATGTKPIVHIPLGQFNIKTTLTIPANSDMQLVGDGLGTGSTTRLVWAGNQVGPLLICKGPSRATIKDLLLNVPYTFVGPEALVIEDPDQPGGRIFGNQFDAGGPQWTQPCDIGLLADGIENSDITMICYYPGFGNTAMVQATGGPVLSSGGNTDGQISLLGGATGDCQNLFNVTDGGRIDAEGMWNEGDYARTSGLVNLNNTSGKLSIACMSWNLTGTPYPMLNTDNFSGTLTLLLNHFNQAPQSYMPLSGDGTNCNVLAAYNDWGPNNTIGGTTDSTWQDMTSPNANADFISNTSKSGALDMVTNKVHNVLPDTTTILNELAQLRAVRTEPPTDRVAGVTDVKLFRVAAWGTKNNVAAHFKSLGMATTVETPAKPSMVTLYPTIVTNKYNVSYYLTKGGTTTFTVYDLYGRILSEKTISDVDGNHTATFSAAGLTAGTFFLKIQSSNLMETKKFMVVR